MLALFCASMYTICVGRIETMKKTNLIKKRVNAGRKGGLKTIEKHGKAHLSRIAKDKWAEYRKNKKNHERKNKNNQ